ncbi:pyrimidine dimer DNA glycosylase/endonuclease V [Natranaerofaba carboxydovora]|uniref:pyrimidine dimer DNA glycosylase/endonuclease V n=1 Tax=Natranaerofaba carboxydovora TaxID=2742683 RepID=UPI001F137F82|nr:pyrimidine dimer DNA glycosylase/endonuclease V [Natranaerofaba carboxydovora]UMZ74261.1 Pyrimidine dimer DNA glycosylase [Natranaerofaba carboxydovora]
MRIWDIEPDKLCRKHLLGEHRELHALWNILTQDKKGYRNHPETCRWVGKLSALYKRHETLVLEMSKRGYNHNSPLDENLAQGEEVQNEYIDEPIKQEQILKDKNCNCFKSIK